MDAHTIIDLATLVSAVVGSALASYRALLARIVKMEKQGAFLEGALRGAGILSDRRQRRGN
jgi:hypothetical protein